MESSRLEPPQPGHRDEEDDIPQLSSHALAALQEFLAENNVNVENPHEQEQESEKSSQQDQESKITMVREDWGLSQFWYDDQTASVMAEELNHLQRLTQSPIACISCPTLYVQLKVTLERSFPETKASLFEFDQRFSKYGEDFIFYDYNKPEDIPSVFLHSFQVIVADPPYLSEECLSKVAKTMELLSDKKKNFLLLLTGKVQRELASAFLNAHPCGFQPMHHHKLGNEFMLFTSYNPEDRLGGWIS